MVVLMMLMGQTCRTKAVDIVAAALLARGRCQAPRRTASLRIARCKHFEKPDASKTRHQRKDAHPLMLVCCRRCSGWLCARPGSWSPEPLLLGEELSSGVSYVGEGGTKSDRTLLYWRGARIGFRACSFCRFWSRPDTSHTSMTTIGQSIHQATP